MCQPLCARTSASLCVFTIALPIVFHYLRPRIRTLIISPHVKPHYIHSPFSKKMADLDHLYSWKDAYRLRAVIHSIHDSFVEIRGGLSYHLRSRHRTAFVILIIPLSSPFSYHFRSAKIFQPPANQPIPQFPSFPNFPRIPRIPAFPSFPRHPVHPFHPFLFMVQFVIIHGDIQKPLSFSARPGGNQEIYRKTTESLGFCSFFTVL